MQKNIFFYKLTTVDGIKIINVEAWIRIFPFEFLRKQLGPGFIAHKDCSQIVVVDLVNYIVLANLW